jgi:hypothetical protein
VSYIFNLSVSKATTIILPRVLADGYLVRWNTRQLVPDNTDYKEFLVLWESLAAFEPYFTVQDNEVVEQVKVPVKPYRAKDGKTYDYKLEDKVVTVSAPAPHLFEAGVLPAQAPISQLWAETKSSVPIVRWDWIMRMLTTTLDDGLYYEFVGIKQVKDVDPDSKLSDYGFFLEKFFATDEKTISDRSSDNRAVTISKVTGKWRRIDAFYGRNARPEATLPLVLVTLDLAEGDDKVADRHPLRNLLNFKDNAKEVIGFKPNGMHLFALFDGQGNLQRAAPDDVVRDHTVPVPYTNRLQPAISCIRCHGPQGGYNKFDNYVVKLLKPSNLNVFDDVSSDEGLTDTLDRLVGAYSGGNMLKVLRRATDDYHDAVFLATATVGNKPNEGAKEETVATVSAALSEEFAAYNYTRVTTQKALLELGFSATEEDAIKAINTILPKVPKDALGISRESPLLGALKVGIPILRSDWEQEYTDAALRVKLIRDWQEQQKAAAAQQAVDQAAAEAAKKEEEENLDELDND